MTQVKKARGAVVLDEFGNGQQHVLRTWVFIERATERHCKGHRVEGFRWWCRRCEDDMIGFVV